jgi:bla regulator protein BlaR1
MDADLLRTIEPGAVALGWTLIDFLWQGALIGVLYALARIALPAPRSRLLAGHVALLALALVPLLTLIGHLDGGAPPAALQAASGAVVSAMEATTRDVGIEADTWLLWLVGAWVIGVVLLSTRLWNEWRRLRRLCDEAAPVDAQWQQRFEQLAAHLGVKLKVRLKQGAQIVTPMLVGVLRPTILLPASLFARLPVDQLELILVHELAHLRRLDPLFNLLQTGLDTLLFYHPVVHWISRKVREDRELCCDEIVVASGGNRLRYARALLALAEARTHDVPMPALAATGGALLERVERIVELPAPRAQNSQSLVAIALLGVLALVWWVPRDDDGGLLDAMPVALTANAATMAAPAFELVIGDIAARFSAPRPVLAAADIEPVAIEPVASEPAIAPPAEAFLADASVATQTASVAPFTPPSLADETRVELQLPAAAPVDLAVAEAPAPIAETPAAAQRNTATATLVPTRRVAPAYPRVARLRGVEGWVVLDYRVDAKGRVVDVEIVDAQPVGTFDVAARQAIERWRYPANAASASLTQRFDFVLSEEQRADSDDRCRRQTGSRVCRATHDLLPGSSVSLSVN